MHLSSLENMQKCRDRYLDSAFWAARDRAVVLDVGGADVNGSYKMLFAERRFQYLSADVAGTGNVDVVFDDPYKIPLADGSIDVVISGQMLEHCEFFWLAFAEMMRVVKPNGFVFLIAPSAGPIHRYPVDCYRFYPDAFRTLAKFADCNLLDIWHDKRGPWSDLVGVFCNAEYPASRRQSVSCDDEYMTQAPQASFVESEENDNAAFKERTSALAAVHAIASPKTYLEMGTRSDAFLSLVRCAGIVVDGKFPQTALRESEFAVEWARSDDLFDMTGEGNGAGPIDLAFFAMGADFASSVRGIMHLERISRPGLIVVIEMPLVCHASQPDGMLRLWRCLSQMRPDLIFVYLECGLLIVTGWDPNNRMLWDDYNRLVPLYLNAAPAEDPKGAPSFHSAIDEVQAILKEAHRLVGAGANTVQFSRHLRAFILARST